MILQFLEKPFLLHHMRSLQGAMEKEAQLQQKNDPGALARRQATGVTAADLQMAKDKLAKSQECTQNEPDLNAVFMPRDAVASQTQSVLQRYVVEKRSDLVEKTAAAANSVVPFAAAELRKGGNAIVDLFTHFGPDDPGWVSCLVAEALVKVEGGPHRFNTGPAPINPIGNNARVVLLADWGTGVPRAQDVAASARRFVKQADSQGRDVHVIHLGDVYYAGFKTEYDHNFLAYWPVQPDEADKFSSYNLNGNHDMYSGGYDYFDYLLAEKRFKKQGGCSFFGLQNDFWQILGLDSAYVDGDFVDPQPQWVLDTRSAAPHKQGVLLSHHQPFSGFEAACPKLLEKLAPVLNQNLVLAWWWGHEHRCAIYSPRNDVRYGRCIGYGGVPIMAETMPCPDGVAYAYQDFVAGTKPQFARFGFTVLDFNKDKLHVQYLGENGVPHMVEDIVAAAQAAG
jgi:hypothetical protein